eukprot:CAMPEP_0203910258 /NCGR_PEP_ID=MMETSP0359-20131031/51498_1 /ASSEMBLY_ACC=CAM_ASM_000338 /TAXON_ID=268821 /ORGANISM="Scrippsiella Hangoei, Strain SHTV-5" /LENGTH=230 /DNA_ID=CAMNT_0050835693 /DNA_START=92 /DNA_END=784 /DNA_ORIENTATION=-
MEAACEASGEAADLSGLQGVPRGGALGPGRFLFRGQLFWQEVLPEHVACSQLEFRIGLGDDRRNLARVIAASAGGGASSAKEVLADDDPLLLRNAVCIPQGREDCSEVVIAIRSAACWNDRPKLRRLLASCFVPPRACARGLSEAASSGNEDIVRELLRARALPGFADEGAGGKTPLHVACEQGQESVARLLLEARADLRAADAQGHTACELARESDFGPIARRLEKDFG